jgi:hypothetical protein
MQASTRSLLLAGLVAGALVAAPLAAKAQVRAMPNSPGYQPPGQTQGATNPPPPPPVNYNAANVVSPAPAYTSPYGYPYGATPGRNLGNTLQGAASAINAQGQFNIQNQQAKLGQQQVDQAKIDTRRKQFDENLYEQANTPTFNELREKLQQEQLRYVRNDPPPGEIWSAAALNTLFKGILQEEAALGLRGPAIPLDSQLTQHIHLTDGVSGSGAGVGALKSSGLDWPYGLQDTPFDPDRMKIDALAKDLLAQVSTGRPQAASLRNLRNAVGALKDKVRSMIEDMTPTNNVKANRFCNELLDAARTLEDPSVVNSFNGKWAVQANTVPGLIDQMTRQGLRFAPAASGDEAAYTALYRAMNDYDGGLNRMAAGARPVARGPGGQ